MKKELILGILIILTLLTSTATAQEINPEILQQIEENGYADVIIHVKEQKPSIQTLQTLTQQEQRTHIARTSQEKALTTLQEHNIDIKRQSMFLPAFSARITKNDLEALEKHPEITAITPNRKVSTLLGDSVPLINADQSWNLQLNETNLTGKGQTICIIDTGIDYTHPDLGGCTEQEFLDGECSKVLSGYDFINDNNNSIDDNGHGTHVAGIAAANGNIKGVAPEAKLISIKSLDGNGNGNFLDVTDGIIWCNENAETYNISIISMSLGGNNHSTYCDSNYENINMTGAINDAISKNITVVAATGNDGLVSQIKAPACIENVTRVGATDKNDVIATWNDKGSDRWALDMVVAPGKNINSLHIVQPYLSLSGTSMATPHVSGAIAIMNQYFELNGVVKAPGELERILNDTGIKILDTATNRNYSRIDILQALSPNLNVELNTSSLVLGLDSVNISWNATDEIAISNVNLSISYPNETVLFESTNISGNIFLNPENLAEVGNYSVFLWANNTNGIISNVSEMFAVIDNRPVIVFYEPDNNETVFMPRNVTIIFNQSSDNPLESELNYSWFVNGYENSTEENFSFNGSDWALGIYNITFFVSNDFGNASVEWNVTLESIPYNISVVSPENNSFHNTSVLLNFSFDHVLDRDSCEYTLNGQIFNLSDCSGEILNITEDGNYNLSVHANNTLGEVFSSEDTIFVFDITPPFINTSLLPPEGFLYFNYSFNVTVNPGVSGLDVLEYSVDSGDSWIGFENASLFYPFESVTSTSNVSILFRAVDNAGNFNVSGLFNYTIDLEEPVVSILNYSLDNGFELNYSVNEILGNTLKKVGYRINKRLVNETNISVVGEFNGTINDTLMAGRNKVYVFAVDAANNIGFDTKNISFDGELNVSEEVEDIEGAFSNVAAKFFYSNGSEIQGIENTLNMSDINFSLEVTQNETGANVTFKGVNASRVFWENNFENISQEDEDAKNNFLLKADNVSGILRIQGQEDFIPFDSYEYVRVVFDLNYSEANTVYYYKIGTEKEFLFSCNSNKENMPCRADENGLLVAYLREFSTVIAGIDSKPPNITIVSPANESTHGQSFVLEVNLSEPGTLNYRVGSSGSYTTCFENAESGSCTVSLPSPNGNKNVNLIAMDLAGNEKTELLVVTRDYTPPTDSGGTGGATTSAPPPPPSEPATDQKSFTFSVTSAQGNTRVVSNINISLVEMIVRLIGTHSNVRFTVSELSGSDLPPETSLFNELIYRVFSIAKQNINDDDIENVTIMFRVSTDWLAENDVNPSNVSLFRYTDEWDELETKLEDIGIEYYTFTAESPGLSYFLVGVVEEIEEVVADIPIEVEEEIESQEVTTAEEEVSTASWTIILLVILLTIILIGLSILVYKNLKTKPSK